MVWGRARGDVRVTLSEATRAAMLPLREALLPSRRPVEDLDNVPLSSRRGQMEPDASRAVESTGPELNLFGLLKHHIRDWIIIVVCIILDVVLNIIHPYERYVTRFDFDFSPTLRFPLKSNTVPLWAVPIIALVIPAFVFVVYFIFRRNTRDLHQALLGLLTAVAITAVFTDAIKDGVGRPRPDFFYRCFPDGIAVYVDNLEILCTGDAATIREGHKSFPSGHSSWSFAGLGYLAFYLAGKLTLFDRRGFSSRILIVLFPLLLAALVAVSRVSNYWHHWQDVTAGALLGLTIAYFSYKQHFPDFSDKLAASPFAYIYINTTTLPSRAAPGGWGAGFPPQNRANGGPYDVESPEI